MADAVLWSGDPHENDYTPGSDVAGGAVVVLGDIPFIAHVPIAANTKGALACGGGTYKVAKATGGALAGGTYVYWDNTNKRVTTTSSGNKKFGFVTPDGAATNDTTVYVHHRPTL